MTAKKVTATVKKSAKPEAVKATAARLTKKADAAIKKAVSATASRMADEVIAPTPVKAKEINVRKRNKVGLGVIADELLRPVKAPVTPLTKLLLNAGFVHARSEAADERDIAHGYTHPDGSAAMFVHSATSTDVAPRWTIKQADGTTLNGKTAKELALALTKPEALPANVTSALDLLRKLTKGTYRLNDLAGDGNYKARLQLLKKLLNTDKVLVKQSGVNNLVKAFYSALDIKTAAAAVMASEFEARCTSLFKQEQKAERVVARVEKAEVKEVLKNTAFQREVHDGKPILPGVKKLSAKKQRAADEAAKAELAAQIAHKRRQEEYTPIAVPRPDSKVDIDLSSICLLEDPNNGIVLMCLEKPNSQGAICVYNNGSRVAAGVVPTEVLNSLRPLVSEDLVRDVNQLLHPITAGVIVTPQAEQQLTAVLNYCKENIIMSTETAVKTKKFAPPASAAKKASKKAAKPALKTAKKSAHDKAERAPRITEDRKIKALITAKDKERMPREGSFCFGQVQAVIGSKTVSEAQAKLDKSGLNPNNRKLEVAWLQKQGFIEVATA